MESTSPISKPSCVIYNAHLMELLEAFVFQLDKTIENASKNHRCPKIFMDKFAENMEISMNEFCGELKSFLNQEEFSVEIPFFARNRRRYYGDDRRLLMRVNNGHIGALAQEICSRCGWIMGAIFSNPRIELFTKDKLDSKLERMGDLELQQSSFLARLFRLIHRLVITRDGDDEIKEIVPHLANTIDEALFLSQQQARENEKRRFYAQQREERRRKEAEERERFISRNARSKKNQH